MSMPGPEASIKLMMASKEQVEHTSLLPMRSPNIDQTAVNNGLGRGAIQTHQSNGNVAVAVDPKVLPKTEGAPTCTICGDTLKPNGKGRGKYTGLKQFACRRQDHTSQMGGKTYY